MKNCIKKIGLLFITLLLSCQYLVAQNGYMVIDSIEVIGNKKTQTKNVIRELDFQIGDTIQLANLEAVIEQNRLLLTSTGLFSSVVIEAKNTIENHVNIDVKLEESWYLYPFFNIEVGDRDLNVWWVEHNHALNRLNYVFQVNHRNLTGRRDLLKIYSQFGYEPKFQITYDLPYFNEAQTLGFRGDAFYAQAREWGMNTVGDKFDLVSNNDTTVIRRFRLTAGLRFQQGVFKRHEAELRFHRHQISDFAADYNPDFLLNGNTLQRYFALTYQFTADYRDFKPYPIKGYFVTINVNKEGFGIFKDINTLYVLPKVAYYQPLSEKFSLEFNLRGKVSFLRKQPPYFNNRALGFRPDYMRGYELYVMDGLDYAMARASLRYEWLNKNFTLNKKKKDTQGQYFPLKIYSTVFHDEAYVNNPFYKNGNTLSNRQLWSFGTGLNFVIYNDFVMQMEYTWNHRLENGFYLHFDLPF